MPGAASADWIVHNAHIVTLAAAQSRAEALAIREDRIIALGSDEEVLKLAGPRTRLLDADGRTVLPGLIDSHVHPIDASSSEIREELPVLTSLEDVFRYIRMQAQKKPPGEWIVLRFAFPTRLREGRFPTRAELDAAAPQHPVLYHAGPASVVNTQALKVSGITRDTPNPPNGVVVKDPDTGEPTGMLRNALGVLKGIRSGEQPVGLQQRRDALRKLIKLYNQYGLTSICDRSASREELDLYYDLYQRGELTIRVNVAREFSPPSLREELVRRLDALPGPDKRGGPTGVGDAWVRVGPIKVYLDGGMLNGTAYMRQPWPKGPAYQITEDNYRGLLFIRPEVLSVLAEEAARRGWQLTAHTAGEGAMDVLLDAYDFAQRSVNIRSLRFCITHANFPSQYNLERCQRLGVVADVQPVWLWKDGSTLLRILGKERLRWFQPYKSWLRYTVIGGGSDHMLKFDPFLSTNPWNPWLGIYTAVARITEWGDILYPEERLTREEALKLYTVNNAYLTHEEKIKGTLEVGKLADLIVLDRDVLTCDARLIPFTKVLYTFVGGRLVYQASNT
ncbi:MAG: amidohydrolase [Gemmatales bacterium]|nr:amidohydrolase [Gemmatales bacterium]MDW8222630.1 amidohydrolase [Gemmatales bacterium]